MTSPLHETRGQKLWREWRGFTLFIAIMLVFRSAIADWNQVPSGSMKPSILVGDRVVIDKLAYDLRVPFTLVRVAWFAEPARGDVVTFPSPVDERLMIKRIVGLPGDLVELRDNVLLINGERARYEPLTVDEIAQLPIDGKRHYRFLRETVAGMSHYVMLQRGMSPNHYDTFGPVRVPDGNYLMLGDNRDNSGDFRKFSWVARERILGRAEAVAFSLDYDRHYTPRLDRFFASLP